MGGAQKHRANRETAHYGAGGGSSSGDTSSSGKLTHSARSDGRSNGGRSNTSRRTAYDGNRDPDSRSGSPRPESSRPGSARPGSARPGSTSGMRDPAVARPAVTEVKHLDLPASAYAVLRGQEGGGRCPRPAPSKAGQPVKIALNSYDTDFLNKATVYQYDVSFNWLKTRLEYVLTWNRFLLETALRPAVLSRMSGIARL